MSDKNILKVNQIKGLACISLNEIEKVDGKRFKDEIEKTCPILKSFGVKLVRATEVPKYSCLTALYEEDTRFYNLYDIYIQSSTHIHATLFTLKLVDSDKTELSEESREYLTRTHLTEYEHKRLRKNIIEIVMKKV